jgi:hypothetical protein
MVGPIYPPPLTRRRQHGAEEAGFTKRCRPDADPTKIGARFFVLKCRENSTSSGVSCLTL